MLLAVFGVGQVLISLIYFFLLLIWIMLLFRVFADVFADREMSGVVKVLWLLFVVITPYLGVFVYLVARGPKMVGNEHRRMAAQEEAVRDYIQSAAGGSATELARLAELRQQGVIDDAEFAKLKARIVN